MLSITHCLFITPHSNATETQLRFKEYLAYCRQPSVIISNHMTWVQLFKAIQTDQLCLWNGDTSMPFKEFDKLAQSGLPNGGMVIGIRFNKRAWVQMSKGYWHYAIQKIKSMHACLIKQLPLNDYCPPCTYLNKSDLQLALKDESNNNALYSTDLIRKLSRRMASMRQTPIMWHDA